MSWGSKPKHKFWKTISLFDVVEWGCRREMLEQDEIRLKRILS